MTDKHETPGEALEPEADDLEKQRAAATEKLVEQVLAGEQPPTTTDTDAALTQVREGMQLLRATVREEPLAPARREQLLAEALAQVELARLAHQLGGDRRGPSRVRRALLAALASAAAVIVLMLGLSMLQTSRPTSRSGARLEHTRSRPSDELLGRPIRAEERGQASARLDLVFADRLAGYRAVRLGDN